MKAGDRVTIRAGCLEGIVGSVTFVNEDGDLACVLITAEACQCYRHCKHEFGYQVTDLEIIS